MKVVIPLVVLVQESEMLLKTFRLMIPIGPYPIILHIMKSYAHYGYKDFIICLGHKERYKRLFSNYEPFTRDFTISFGDSGGISYHSNHDEKRLEDNISRYHS